VYRYNLPKDTTSDETTPLSGWQTRYVAQGVPYQISRATEPDSDIVADFVANGWQIIIVDTSGSDFWDNTSSFQSVSYQPHVLHPTVEIGATCTNEEQESLGRRICAMLAEIPIESGIYHPAQATIAEALKSCGGKCITSLVFRAKLPCSRADLVQCISRLPLDSVDPWGYPLAKQLLQDENIEIRDGAICALEHWGGQEALVILRNHHDSSPILREYVAEILDDLALEST